jgi:hypothetical protein
MHRNPKKPLVQRHTLRRALRAGDKVYAIYPIAIARGTIVEDGGAYGKRGNLGFVSGTQPGEPLGWTMPIDAISGRCTYSTHSHVVLASLDDEAVAARFAKLDAARSANARRQQIHQLSDEQVLALNWPT